MLQNYLIFISTKINILGFLLKHLKFIHGNLRESQKKVLLRRKKLRYITISDNKFAATLIDYYFPDVQFNGNCLVRNINTSLKIINLYICYTLDQGSRDLNTDLNTLNNFLFGSV